MILKRRAFLQQTAATLAAVGLSEAALLRLTEPYQRALALPAPRKLALLIGINQYPETVCDYPPKNSALTGCLTDVELQQELLSHRFGFAPSDILVLTDQTATRQNIIQTFQTHLLEQSRPGDLILFHFSGLGSQVQVEQGQVEQGQVEQGQVEPSQVEQGQKSTVIQNTLVPIDGLLPTVERPLIQDLSLDTLALLLRALPTQQIITVLDVGYSRLGRTIQGNFRIRSRPNAPIGSLSPIELALPEQLKQAPTRGQPQTSRQWQPKQLPGLILQASANNLANVAMSNLENLKTNELINSVAAETQWNGFSCGLFTYALTQQLWEATPATTLWFSFQQAKTTVQQVTGIQQQPIISGLGLGTGSDATTPGQTDKSFSLAPLLTISERFNERDGKQYIGRDNERDEAGQGAEGVIRSIDQEGKLRLWLAGLPATVLENQTGSLVTVGSSLLQLRSREGLTVKAHRLPNPAQSEPPAEPPALGQLVQEAWRIFPHNLGLTVALDSSLERIERVDATSAFAALPRISAVAAGGQAADFLFGKTQSAALLAALPTSVENVPESPNGYGLFSPGGDVILNSLHPEIEAVKTAVARLTPQLKTLLALKLIRLTQNQGSSRLGVQAALELATPQRLIQQQETIRLPHPTHNAGRPRSADATLSVGNPLQYRLHNYGQRPVYFLLVGFDPKGNVSLLYPSAALSPLALADTVILPAETAWLTQAGLCETHVIFSVAPFSQTAQVLGPPAPDLTQAITPTNLLAVAQAILQDLHQASGSPPAEIPADSYALDVNAWATLSFVYQLGV
jgi:hypothetical protein